MTKIKAKATIKVIEAVNIQMPDIVIAGKNVIRQCFILL